MDQHPQVFERVLSVEPAALDQGVHEGGVIGGLLASDVLAVLEVQLYRLHPLFAQVVGYLGSAVLQEAPQRLLLVEQVADRLCQQGPSHERCIRRHRPGVAEDTVDHPNSM